MISSNHPILRQLPQSKLLSTIVFFMTSFEKIQQFYHTFMAPTDEPEQEEKEQAQPQPPPQSPKTVKISPNVNNNNNNNDHFIDELKAAFDTDPVDVNELLCDTGKFLMILFSLIVVRRLFSMYRPQ